MIELSMALANRLPQQLARAMEHSLEQKLNKDEFLTLKLITNWSYIAGNVSKICLPVRLYIKQALLIVSADPGYSINIQYQAVQLCHLINAFLGKKYITKIMVKNTLNG